MTNVGQFDSMTGMTRIELENWITLKQAVELTNQNRKFIQRKANADLIRTIKYWGLNHCLYSIEDVRKFIKK